MKKVDDYEEIRRAYNLEHKSIRAIHRQMGYDRETIRKAIVNPAPDPYRLKKAREARVIGPYQQRITELLDQSEKQRRKQRYTAHRIYEILQGEGYLGSEGAIHNHVCQQRKKRKHREAYIPLEFDPGSDAQVDWGEAEVEIAGKMVMVQLFIMRLNYSRARFVMAFPFQKQEAFFEGHIQAYHFFGGVPQRQTYDNLKTAVFKILEGRNRQEQVVYKTFRSYYLFESHYCTPAQGHEKGGVESDVGYAQRNFMTPILKVASYEELNAVLQKACLENVQRHIRGKEAPVAQLWEEEKRSLLGLPNADYAACTSYPVKPNGYSQVELDTNRYSVPVTHRDSQLVLQAYPFRVKVLSGKAVIADHPRCFGREQDVIDPLHYLTLLEQRPGAFEHAKPIRDWRQHWPKDYDQLLEELRQRWPDGRGVREFIAILKLHLDHPAEQVQQAVRAAIELGATHLDGVRLCLHQLQEAPVHTTPLDMSVHPQLADYGNQPVDLKQYDQLLSKR